jgi:energy-coupling factor transport system substrate-specific component
MYTAGWVGLSAPLCRPLVDLSKGHDTRREVVILALFGGMWGLAYGGIMNIWFWPFAVGQAGQNWQPGIGWSEVLGRYLVFYMCTSFGWDMIRLVGNVTLVLAFGLPTLRALRRFERRFAFTYQPEAGVSS